MIIGVLAAVIPYIFVMFLKANGVGSRTMYPPINRQEAYGAPGHFPVSETVGRDGLWLPSASQLEDTQVKTVCDRIKAFYASGQR